MPATAPPARRLGLLLVNPGGPGASGLWLVSWIASNDATYHLGATRPAVGAAYAATLQRLGTQPIAAGSGPLIGPDELSDTLLIGGYYEDLWPPSARMVAVIGSGIHGQSLTTPPNDCVDGYLNNYLASGALPEQPGLVNATCAALPAPTGVARERSAVTLEGCCAPGHGVRHRCGC